MKIRRKVISLWSRRKAESGRLHPGLRRAILNDAAEANEINEVQESDWMTVFAPRSAALEVVAPTPDEIAVSLEGVGHWFDGPSGRTQTLSGVNIQIKTGEFFTVLGPSGCGKTTLLNIVGGFIEAKAGDVAIFGEPVSGPGPDRGVIFQSYALFR